MIRTLVYGIHTGTSFTICCIEILPTREWVKCAYFILVVGNKFMLTSSLVQVTQ